MESSGVEVSETAPAAEPPVSQEDATAGSTSPAPENVTVLVIQRLIQRLVLGSPDIQAAGDILGHLRGGEAGKKGGVVLPVGVEPGLEDAGM